MSRSRPPSASCAAPRTRGSKKLISERDFEKARDDAAAARVNHKHAIETAGLQKESLEFELRARRLERDRQRLVVAGAAAARRRSQHEVAGQRHRRHARCRGARLGRAERTAPHRRRSDCLRDRDPGAGELCGRSRLGDGSGSDLCEPQVRGEGQRGVARGAVGSGDRPPALLGRGRRRACARTSGCRRASCSSRATTC